MRLNLNVVGTPRGVSGVREETIVYLPAEKTSPAFFRCTPAIACRVRTWRRLHQPFTGYAVEFHDEQPGYRLGKLRGLFADTAW